MKDGSYMYIFPLLSVKTGSFVYDVSVGLDNWQPSQVRISVCIYCTYVSTHTHTKLNEVHVLVSSPDA